MPYILTSDGHNIYGATCMKFIHEIIQFNVYITNVAWFI